MRQWRGRWIAFFSLMVLPLGCSQGTPRFPGAPGVPLVRVQLLQDQSQVNLSATQSPLVRVGSSPSVKRLNFQTSRAVTLALSSTGTWTLGSVTLGNGELTLLPAADGTVSINGSPYRGNYRFVPSGHGRFDVLNDLDVESYLMGVLPSEMPRNWEMEAYKAQAIVARTYAVYVAMTSHDKAFDLFDDQRSQVYGGIGAETDKSRQAVTQTRGVVVAYGDKGQERIFKAYFSSCCGGVTQSASDAFGDSYIPPLSDQNNGALCNASPRFNWGPVVISWRELTRRVRLWGIRKNRAEKDIGTLTRIDIQARNRWQRPTRFILTDDKGRRFSVSGEELRWAVNTDAPEGSTLYSSFVKIINDPDVVRFVDGHGFGHGVGLCQWCAEARAQAGMRHEDIVLAAFPRAVLVRAF